MATLLSVRAESALLCLLQSHPFQPAGGHMGQTLQDHLQPLQCLLLTIHGHHSSQHKDFHLLHKNRHESQLFTLPLSYMFLRAGLWVSFAPWLGENCLIQLILHGVCTTSKSSVLPLIQIRGTTVAVLCFCSVTGER